MLIHNSHTKEELIKLIKLLKLDIKYSNLLKDEIMYNFYDILNISKSLKFERNALNIKNVTELIKYLESPAKKLKTYISVKDKQNLIEMSRTLIAYVNTGCDFDLSIFTCPEDLHHTIIFICKYGGKISTCRRSINMLNNTLPPDKRYEMDLDYETKKLLDEKEMKRFLSIPKFYAKQKKVIVDFS